MNRMHNRIIEIPAMTESDLETFIRDLVAYVRNPNFDVSHALELAANETDEEMKEEFYPFTENAVKAIGRARAMILPRSICRCMLLSAGHALMAKRHVVTKKDVQTLQRGIRTSSGLKRMAMQGSKVNNRAPVWLWR